MPVRPSIPSREILESVCETVRNGVPAEVAAAAAGVDEPTFEAWMARGERGGRGAGAYMAFCDAVAKARAEAQAQLVRRIADAAAEGHWQAAAWLLERAFAEKWGRKSIQPKSKREIESANVGSPDPFAELDNVEPITSARARRATHPPVTGHE